MAISGGQASLFKRSGDIALCPLPKPLSQIGRGALSFAIVCGFYSIALDDICDRRGDSDCVGDGKCRMPLKEGRFRKKAMAELPSLFLEFKNLLLSLL
ncbi:hypothetical protein [Nodosilinea sp. FACHB-13]|uniref:hypothetical protein n=1 Tax=Cyanophyceae TaxID=3028117 RepID=UPI001689535A|nr:hypothetical protein [Nodosilinea sp. FACHB-13]MBD2108473.1 hypothetical protein [Nodosilinea sp. FACHB-13]